MEANNETLGQTLIPVINRLQDIFSQVSPNVRLDLPQVAVVGSQSSGKSSVLEALVGRDFLPRGSNIVTRRPLILQLIKTSASSGQNAEWGEFLHCQGKRFFDFERIRQEILTETERITGGNKGISEKPIRLRIFSPHVLTMTLVDLPGVARVPVGDQPPDIEAKLRALILDYISHPSCIILAVSPANQDLASSDALELARAVDPEGVRTIGVLTKLDIMDRGTDAGPALRNTIVPLRLGYVGVVLRSQEDIAGKKTMVEARGAENAFFASRPEYTDLMDKCGVSNLSRCLNAILVESIRDALPTLRSRLEEAITSRRRELKVLGDAPPGSSNASRGALLLTLLDSYATRFTAALDGHGEHLPVTELAGGARIRHIFQEIFTAGLDGLDPTGELSDEDVRTAIKNSGGVKGSLLIPEAPFELLVRRAIERLLAPSLQCKDFVHVELLRVAEQCMPPDVGRFPILQTLLAEAVESFVNNGAAPAESMIRNLLACELAYINTSHPQFIGGNRAIAQVLERRAAGDVAGGRHGMVDSSGRSASAPALHNQAKRGGVAGGVVHTTTGRNASGGSINNNGVVGSSGRRHGEPELFQPQDLLGGIPASYPLAGTLKDSNGNVAGNGVDGGDRLGLAAISDGGRGGGGWFTGWFGRGGIGEDGVAEAQLSPGADSLLKKPPLTLRVPKDASDQEGVQVEVTRVLVDSYFDIVRKNLQDAIPKALMHFLVNSVRRGLQQHLIRSLYREELFSDIMNEREDVAMKRKECQEALHTLRTAMATLESIPAEMLGRVVNQSGIGGNHNNIKINFKGMMDAMNDVTINNNDNRSGSGGRDKNGTSNNNSRPSSRSSSPLKSGAAANETTGGVGERGRSGKIIASSKAQQQMSAAQKAALSAVSFLGGGIPALHQKQ